MNTEDKHLLFCLNTDNEASKTSVLAKWTDSDWNCLVRQSIKRGVAPYLYHRLKIMQPAADITADAGRRLKDIYLHSASRNIRLYHDLGKVLHVLLEDHIPVLVLKGAHLAELVYGNIALRPMVDVDLMVRREDLARTAQGLEKLNYSPRHPFRVESHAHVRRHLPGFTRTGAVPIEIHHAIVHHADPFQISTDDLWRRAKPARIAGIEVLVLSQEDLLLNLCLHVAYQHRFLFCLRGLCDVIETLRSMKNPADAENLVKRAMEWKAGRCAFFTLSLAGELLGGNTTEAFLKSFEPYAMDSESLAWAKEQIFAEPDHGESVPHNLVRAWKIRGLHHRAAALMKSVFVPRSVMAALYPAPPDSMRMYLFYLVRIRDVFRRYGRTAWRLLFHSKEAESGAEHEDRGNALEKWITAGADGNALADFTV